MEGSLIASTILIIIGILIIVYRKEYTKNILMHNRASLDITERKAIIIGAGFIIFAIILIVLKIFVFQ